MLLQLTSKKRLSLELLGDAAVSLTGAELISDVLSEEITPRDRIEFRLRDASALLDVEPALAWHRVVQAHQLHDKADRHLAEQIHRLTLSVASRFIIDGYPEGLDRQEILNRGHNALDFLGQSSARNIFDELVIWADDRDKSPMRLLRLIQSTEGRIKWVHSALTSITQALLTGMTAASYNIKDAEYFLGPVRGMAGDCWIYRKYCKNDLAVENSCIQHSLHTGTEKDWPKYSRFTANRYS